MSSSGSTGAREAVIKWLEDEGYPLEMRTARAFRRAGADVAISQFYEDPESHEVREIDVIATFGTMEPSDPSKRISVAVSFVCECKLSKKKSWVMFTTPMLASELPVEGRVFHSRWGNLVDKLKGRWAPNRSSIDVTGIAAYNGVPAHTTTDERTDAVFKALHAATKASYAYAVETQGRVPTLVHIVFPVIIVDGLLFGCSLPDTGDDVEVDALSRGVPLRWARPIGGRKLTVVDVVPADALDAYVADSATMADELADELRRSHG